MESIGEILKNAREQRGLSLQEVHDASKITVQNLTALEEDRFDFFPNRVYARAFLRDYANFLGLDSAELLNRYEENWGKPVEVEPVTRGGSVWRGVGYTFAALIVLAGLLVVGYLGWTGYNRAELVPTVERSTGEGSDEDIATLPSTEDVNPDAEVEKPAEKPAQPASTETQVKPEKVVLKVGASRNAWIRVKTDGQVAFEGYLEPGVSRTWEGNKSVYIRTGDAGALSIKVNDQPKPRLGAQGQVAETTFKLEDIGGQAPQENAAPTEPQPEQETPEASAPQPATPSM